MPTKTGSFKHITCGLTSSLFCLASFSGVALEQQNELLNLSLEELLQVTVTASTRTQESLRSVPSVVTVFERSQIEKLGLDYLYELLDFVPGYQSHRASDSPLMYSSSSRGRRNGSQSKELLLIMDGRVFNDTRNGSANGARPLVKLSQVEKVEVIRGPGSAIYGSNAYTGVIKVTSRRNESFLLIESGSQERNGASLAKSFKSDNWSFDIQASLLADDGEDFLVDNANNSDPLFKVATSDPRTIGSLELAMHSEDFTFRYANAKSESEGFFVVETLRDDINRVNIDSQHWYLSYRKNWDTKFQSALSISRMKAIYDLDLQLVAEAGMFNISEPQSNDPLIGLVNLVGVSNFVQIHNNWEHSERLNIQFGAEWRKDDEVTAKAFNNYDIAEFSAQDYPVTYYGDFNQFTLVGTEGYRDSYSMYGQYLNRFSKGELITIGFRYDHFSDAGSHTSPRIGWSKSLSEQHSVKVLYGEAFRAPALNETQLINNSVIVGNPDLTHEIVKTWDFVWSWKYGNNSFTTNIFHNKFVDPINSSIVNNVRQFVNGDAATSTGIEFEASHQLNENWYLRETYSYFWKLPEAAFRESDKMASLILNYAQPRWNWNLSAIFHGEKSSPSAAALIQLDDYWLVQTKFIYQYSPSVKWELQLKNVFDEAYFSAASGNTLSEGLPNRGREVKLAVSWSLD